MPPAAKKYALLIGNDRYADYPTLTVPAADVAGLKRVLEDPAIGAFDTVRALMNPALPQAQEAISELFARRARDDLVLLYFSGHGERDGLRGALYLALPDSRRDCLRATAIAADFIKTEQDESHAGRQILILDCCHAGAVGEKGGAFDAASFGGVAPVEPAATPALEANGYGRVTLTSSTATQTSWEGNQVIDGVERSLFTHFLIRGLETGEAAEGQPRLSIGQLYRYAHNAVVAATDSAGHKRMTPQCWVHRQQGELIIARNPFASVRAPDPKTILDATLLADLDSTNHRTRVGAVRDLTEQLGQPALRAAVIAVLGQRLRHERDFQVRDLIEAALKAGEAGDGNRSLIPPGLPPDPPAPGRLVLTLVGVATLAVVGVLAYTPARPPAPPVGATTVESGSVRVASALAASVAPVKLAAPTAPVAVSAGTTPVQPLASLNYGHKYGPAFPTTPIPAVLGASAKPAVSAAPVAGPAVPTAAEPLPTFSDSLKNGSAWPTTRIPAVLGASAKPAVSAAPVADPAVPKAAEPLPSFGDARKDGSAWPTTTRYPAVTGAATKAADLTGPLVVPGSTIPVKPLTTFSDRLKDGSAGPTMVRIPAGSFLMGSPDTEPERSRDEQQRLVEIKQPFAIGKYEITVAQFRRFVEANSGYQTEAEKGDGCYGWKGGPWKQDKAISWRTVDFEQTDDSPVVCVSWNDALDYAAWLSKGDRQGVSPAHRGRMGICRPCRDDHTLLDRRLHLHRPGELQRDY